jgi:hypothetical protein
MSTEKDPNFGRVIEKQVTPEGSTVGLRRDFHNGRPTLIERSREETVQVVDEQHAYSIIADGLSLLKKGFSRVDFSVVTDPITHNISRITTTRIQRIRQQQAAKGSHENQSNPR